MEIETALIKLLLVIAAVAVACGFIIGDAINDRKGDRNE